MKNKNKSNKKIALIIVGVVFLCLAAGGAWYYYNQQQSSKTIPNNTQNPVNEPDGKPQTEAKEREKAESTQNTSSNQSANLQITDTNQDSINIDIGVTVTGAKEGTCTLKLQKSGQNDIIKTAPVGLVTNYYICRGFTISKNEIPSKGDWKIVVQLTNSNVSGQTEGIINVN